MEPIWLADSASDQESRIIAAGEHFYTEVPKEIWARPFGCGVLTDDHEIELVRIRAYMRICATTSSKPVARTSVCENKLACCWRSLLCATVGSFVVMGCIWTLKCKLWGAKSKRLAQSR